MRKVHNIFEPKASRIIRALLVEPSRKWTLRNLASQVGISVGYAHAVISKLLELNCVARATDYSLRVTDPKHLLRRWAAYNQYDRVNKFLEYYTFEREVETFIRKLTKVKNFEYALTVLAGALLVVPYVRPVDVHMYIPDIGVANGFVKALDLRPIPKGGNVKLVIPYDEGVFYQSQVVDGVRVVSDVQLYVDLFNYPARGEEAAQPLYDKIVEKWSKTLQGD